MTSANYITRRPAAVEYANYNAVLGFGRFSKRQQQWKFQKNPIVARPVDGFRGKGLNVTSFADEPAVIRARGVRVPEVVAECVPSGDSDRNRFSRPTGRNRTDRFSARPEDFSHCGRRSFARTKLTTEWIAKTNKL